MYIADVTIRKEQHLKVLNKIESLIKIGVKADIIEPYDVSYLRNRIKRLRIVEDYKEFKASDDYREFRELMKICGMLPSSCKLLIHL